MNPKFDLTGKRFGRLVVQYLTDKRGKHHERIWHCKCDCGTEVDVRAANLKNGTTQSCGCYASEYRRKFNTYDLTGEYGIGYATNCQQVFLFDLDDYDIIKKYGWTISGEGYVVASDGRHHNIRLHRLIMDAPDGILVDHINHDPLDNRKQNLRFATKQQNAINRYAGINSNTGVKGVHATTSGRYYANIQINGKTEYLGTYDTLNDALNVRRARELEVFGEFACNEEIVNE